uniref:DNA-directed DNA polymerase n=1 Tax=Macrostomum lignano TaxID=282301 RepID=A0A1I8FQ89_9PLAT
AHVGAGHKIRKRTPASAPQLARPGALRYCVCRQGTPGLSEGRRPITSWRNNATNDTNYYWSNQLANPLTAYIEPILATVKHRSMLLSGEHTRVKAVVFTPKLVFGRLLLLRQQPLPRLQGGCCPQDASQLAVCKHCGAQRVGALPAGSDNTSVGPLHPVPLLQPRSRGDRCEIRDWRVLRNLAWVSTSKAMGCHFCALMALAGPDCGRGWCSTTGHRHLRGRPLGSTASSTMRNAVDMDSASVANEPELALKRLQLSLNDFRRLCILKGVYPQEPVNTAPGHPVLLGHERVMQKLRDIKAHLKKAKRAKGARRDAHGGPGLQRNFPAYTLDHIIRERYPAFEDAVRDLERLSLPVLPVLPPAQKSAESPSCTGSSPRRALRKVFVSIKGYYFEADVTACPWCGRLPHQLGLHDPADVDFKILRTFNDFYTTMLGFVTTGCTAVWDWLTRLRWLTRVHGVAQTAAVESRVAAKPRATRPSRTTSRTRRPKAPRRPAPPGGKGARQQRLFNGCRFFLNRETPRQILCFVIRSWPAR